MGYDRGDSFTFNFEHKWKFIWFRKSIEKLSPLDHIPLNSVFPSNFKPKSGCVFTIFRLIWDSRNGQCPFAVPNQSKKGNYNLISV